MTIVYCVNGMIRVNEELILDSVGTVCATEELAKREIQKSIDHLIEVEDELGFGECSSHYYYCDAAGVQYLLFNYANDKKLTYNWRIYGIELIES